MASATKTSNILAVTAASRVTLAPGCGPKGRN